ncbi:hypothetical protein CB0940_03596 [Cercospora beticola]|uniref:Uncharacterized protein n=1 Tax=Cercospora beticola TaxID=122368 RepID=A0A2G5I485_CERBT|nr:hypothetical protein CB0940_03596 [Cercospora beticola]PIA99615.1 hypothetical protein CB0940_03596 [Cercospora beticola]WPB00775.1 hypothetical protein RHO25_005395 [Cercospora beticola]
MSIKHSFPTAQSHAQMFVASKAQPSSQHKTPPTYRALRDLHQVGYLKPITSERRPYQEAAIQRMQSEEALRKVYEQQLLLYLNSCYDDLEDVQDASDDGEK